LKNYGKMKDTATKIWHFVQICAWIVGAIGGTAIALTSGYWFVGICIAAVAAMAVPHINKFFKDGDVL